MWGTINEAMVHSSYRNTLRPLDIIMFTELKDGHTER